MKRVVIWGAVVLGPWLGACPEGASQKLSARCDKAYEKCLLDNGVLGVCDVVECEADVEARGSAREQKKAPPCLACRSQH